MRPQSISNGQYRRLVDESGHRSAFHAGHPFLGLADRPVVGVSWADVQAFGAHYGLRLHSEREYECADYGTTQ